MLYSAIVYRNSEFGKTGLIDVMLWQKCKDTLTDTVWSKPFYTIGSDGVKKALGIDESILGNTAITSKCLVTTGMSNGYNAGMAYIPQVGTYGLVAEISDDWHFGNVRYVWLGGLYGNKQNGEKVMLPNDDTTVDDIDAENKPYIVETAGKSGDTDSQDTISDSEYIKKGAFMIKTKTHFIDDYDNIDQEKADWKNILAENTFLMAQDKFAARHDVNDYENNKQKGFEYFVMDDQQVVLKRKINNDDKLLEQTVKMDNELTTFTMTNEDGDSEVVIEIANDGNMKITTTGEMSVSAEKDISFKTDKNFSIESSGTMNFKSGQKMQIHGMGKNLAKIIDDLAQTVATLQTQGSPAYQAVQPVTISSAQLVKSDLAANYDQS